MHRDPVEGHTLCCECQCGGECQERPACEGVDWKESHTWWTSSAWSTGGTGMSHRSKCQDCGATLVEVTTGAQRNPGECDTWRIQFGEDPYDDNCGDEHCAECDEPLSDSDCPACNASDYCQECEEPWEYCDCDDGL